jgi:hypothetical protein
MVHWKIMLGLHCLAFVLQSFMFINWDVSFLLHSSRLLLGGGSYASAFFETNPPMILYIYTVPVLLAELLSIDVELSLRLLVFIVSLLSILLSTAVSVSGLAPVLAVVFLLLPAHEFGQREHLCVMMVMPYVFVLGRRLGNKSVHTWLAVVIGFMAGVGFGIKPFFLIPLILFELHAISQDRKLAIRIETLIILAVMIGYVGSVFLLLPDYLYVVVPVLLQLYYPGFGETLLMLLLRPGVIFCLGSLAFYSVLYKGDDHDCLPGILSLGVVGFLLSYLFARTLWYYHLLPGLVFATVLASIVFKQFVRRHWKTAGPLIVSIVGLLLFWFPVGAVTYFNAMAILDREFGWRSHILEHLKAHHDAGTSWYLISTRNVIFPVFEEAGLVPTLRFPNFWWMPGLLKLKAVANNPAELKDLNAKENYFINLVAEDLETRSPDMVLIDNREYDYELALKNFDYLTYLSKGKRFERVWRSYRYVETVRPFKVYERIASY